MTAGSRRSYQELSDVSSILLDRRPSTGNNMMAFSSPTRRLLTILAAVIGAIVLLTIVNPSSREMYTTRLQSVPLFQLSHHDDSGTNMVNVHEGCEGTVMLIRHCEKGNIKEHCSNIGFERSVYLATLFGDNDERWPAPSYIFAEGPGGRKKENRRNYREVETVLPIAEKANVTVDGSFDTSETRKLTSHILDLFSSGAMCGKLALISWKHSGIPRIAKKLHCGPSQGCPRDYHYAEFDKVWEIKFLFSKMKHSSHNSGRIPRHSLWQVSGSVQQENFDPLAYSKLHQDYPPDGRPYGQGWEDRIIDVPEGGEEEVFNGKTGNVTDVKSKDTKSKKGHKAKEEAGNATDSKTKDIKKKEHKAKKKKTTTAD